MASPSGEVRWRRVKLLEPLAKSGSQKLHLIVAGRARSLSRPNAAKIVETSNTIAGSWLRPASQAAIATA
jgi:hypothetical protein